MISKKTRNYIIIIIISIFLTFILNSSILFPNIYHQYHFVGITSIIALGANFVFWLAMTLLAGCNRFFRYFAFPCIIVLQTLCITASLKYGTSPAELSIAIFNACWQETLIYLTFSNIISFSALFASIVLLVYLSSKFSPLKTNKKPALISCIIAVFLFIPFSIPYLYCYAKKLSNPAYKDDPITFEAIEPISPSQHFIISLYDYLTPPELADAACYNSLLTDNPSPEIIILYIGEAYRADHSPLNGYRRNTMPAVSKETNIINFPFVHSRATQTLSAIYSILTLTSPTTGEASHNSFISIFKKHNFKNHLLVGANTGGKWYLTSRIAPLLHNQISLHSNPESPNAYKKAIEKILEDKSSPIFVLIEDGAGHQPYNSENTTFGTDSEMNKYDNCLVDVDARLHAIINALKNTNAILIFTSDHGESFGEGGRYGHAGPISAKEQTHVCTFIWYSDKYAETHPEIINNLKNNVDKFTSHDNIYHTIISIAGIQSEVQIMKQDMTKEL